MSSSSSKAPFHLVDHHLPMTPVRHPRFGPPELSSVPAGMLAYSTSIITCIGMIVYSIRRFSRPASSLIERTHIEWAAVAISGEQKPDDSPKEPATVAIPIQAYITLASLVAIYVSNQWCRQFFNYIVNFSSTDAYLHINAALDISREQYAALSGAGFIVFYALMSLVAGSLADRSDRKAVAVGSAFVWSIATACQALCTSFSGVAVLRAIQGISQAFCTPAAYTLIADSFPKASLATMNGIYGSAIYMGGALASLGILLNNEFGWRNTAVLIGAFGSVVAAAGIFLIQTPSKDVETKPTAPSSPPEDVTTVVTNVFRNVWSDAGDVVSRRDTQLILLAATVRFCAGHSLWFVLAVGCIGGKLHDFTTSVIDVEERKVCG